MPKFPTEAEHSVTVKAPIEAVYKHFWNVVSTAKQIPGIESCKSVGKDLYRFVYEERSQGPVTICVRYTSQYEGNGTNQITYKSVASGDDNADVEGKIKLQSKGPGSTKITLWQMMAPELPVPRLLQPLARPIVQRETSEGLRGYLENVKQLLEA